MYDAPDATATGKAKGMSDLTRITERSSQRVAELADRIGPERAASVLGVRTRQVERWIAGTGQTSHAHQQRIGQAARKIDAIEKIATGARADVSERKLRGTLRGIARSSRSDSRKTKRNLMRDIWEEAPDDAPDAYETIYG